MTDDLSDILVNTVLVKSVATATDRSGDDLRTPSAGTSYAASVQMAGEAEVMAQGRQGANAVGVVYFDREPLDTSVGADHPRLRVRDLIEWQADGTNPAVRELIVSGPPKPEGGFGTAWSVEVEEIT